MTILEKLTRARDAPTAEPRRVQWWNLHDQYVAGDRPARGDAA